jgi:hypothetical protein
MAQGVSCPVSFSFAYGFHHSITAISLWCCCGNPSGFLVEHININRGYIMDEVTMLDVLISQTHSRIEVSRGELVSAMDRGEHVEQAQARHDKNVKRLRELMDKKFPETVGVW